MNGKFTITEKFRVKKNTELNKNSTIFWNILTNFLQLFKLLLFSPTFHVVFPDFFFTIPVNSTTLFHDHDYSRRQTVTVSQNDDDYGKWLATDSNVVLHWQHRKLHLLARLERRHSTIRTWSAAKRISKVTLQHSSVFAEWYNHLM